MTNINDLLDKLKQSTNLTNSTNSTITTVSQLNKLYGSQGISSSMANSINANLFNLNKKAPSVPSNQLISTSSQKAFLNFENSPYSGINAGQIQSQTEPLQLNITNKGNSLTSYAIPASYTKQVLPSSVVISNAGLLKAMGYSSNVNKVQFTNIYNPPTGKSYISPTQTIVSSTPPILQDLNSLGSDISNFFNQLGKDLSSIGAGFMDFINFIEKYWMWILLGLAGVIGSYLYISHKGKEQILNAVKSKA